MKAYTNEGPVNCDAEFDSSNVKGKTAIVTGGANGIGEAYVRALVGAGAFVLIADINEADGTKLSKEMASATKFEKCDVTSWADQLAVFKSAISSSPSGKIDIVVANAGIGGEDPVFSTNVEEEDPEEPRLKTLDVDLVGVLYTIKLALHYFRRQNALSKGEDLDQVLVIQGSLAGFLGLPGALQYSASKYGLRGVFRTLRLTEHQHKIRVSYIGPWFIETKIMNDKTIQQLKDTDTAFATVQDCARALMRIVSDSNTSGRAFAILPRQWAAAGYMDLCDDDKEDTLLGKLTAGIAAARSHPQGSDAKPSTKVKW
ncbi:glucose 1-dehydrogenase [Exophiala viscosa]|uniref:Glucose 1-dehydrogenase n=1 Tax=Exophiala viscosa TaxID=2486360 RepID=A0AAN6IDZ5_9EURO|nr:glucose 1-dehydrogenase [Exophiala viscosa]